MGEIKICKGRNGLEQTELSQTFVWVCFQLRTYLTFLKKLILIFFLGTTFFKITFFVSVFWCVGHHFHDFDLWSSNSLSCSSVSGDFSVATISGFIITSTINGGVEPLELFLEWFAELKRDK